jgi:hypothetical protein
MQPHRPHKQSRHRPVVDLDPEDPAQRLDDADHELPSLAVEAQPASEAEAELAAAAAEVFAEQGGEEGEEKAVSVTEPAETHAELFAQDAHETGELYGVRTPHASDTDVPEDRDAFDEGQNWLEALGERAAEGGPVEEEAVVVVDDSDLDHRGHHPTERDRPVADKGSGGPGGL